MSPNYKAPALVAALLCTTAILPTTQANAFIIDNASVDGATVDGATLDGDGVKTTDGTKTDTADLSEIKEREEAELEAAAEAEAELEAEAANTADAVGAQPAATSPILAVTASASTNLIYGASFIARFPNAVSALDLVRRIPGSDPILQRGQNSQSRGFGSNDDGVLINGKRISGKQNNSQDALARIKKDNVEYVEIIRGASPDVKVSSQEAMINVVLKEGVSGGSGTWKIGGRYATDGRVSPEGLISYGGKSGKIEYFAEVKLRSFITEIKQEDRVFDADLNPVSLQTEVGEEDWRSIDFSGNLTYNMKDGDQLRLNGLIRTSRMKRPWAGELFDANGAGGFDPAGTSIRFQNHKVPSQWEVGGDYETKLSDKLRLKIIGLHAVRDTKDSQSEDFLIDTPEPEVDFLFSMDRKSSESIGRAGVTWDMGGGKSLEIGDEVAFNKVSSLLDYQELISGQGLVSQTISGADVTVKETRSESFANYSMKLNDKMNLDASLKYEYSKISQNGVGVDTSKSLEFWKPSVDYRYNITKSDQLQVSYRREVSQLNFGDFASSASQDDEVIAGNADLEPEKTWKFEASYEHRFANDGGRIKARFVYDRISDVIQRIAVTPGVSGVGNAGKASRYKYELSGSLRFGFIGVPDLQLNGKISHNDSSVTDPFTGEKHLLNWHQKWNYNLGLRHDMNDIGLSWGLNWWHDGPHTFNDIDEVISRPQSRNWMQFFVEYQLFKGTTLNLQMENLVNPDDGRVRDLYNAGVAGGLLSGREVRDLRWGRRLSVSLKGTF